jgi:hypothetical protein
MPDWIDPFITDALTRAMATFAGLDDPVRTASTLLGGALMAALGARLAIGAAAGFVLYEQAGAAALSPALDHPVHLVLAALAALGLLQAILNLAFGRDTGGTVLWSIIAFVGVVTAWRGPGALLRVLRFWGSRR